MADRIITIAREFGSGGREIGLMLSQKLGIPFYDKELLKLAAEHGGLDEEFIAANEEKTPQLALPSFGRVMLDTFYQPSFSDTIFLEQTKIIKAIAEKGPCVIVGRCADYVLEDTDAVKVFITAGMPYKISRKFKVAPEKANYTDEQMAKYIKDVDKQRRKYYEHYTGRRYGDLQNYDLCIRTDEIESQGAVDIIMAYLNNCK